MTEINLDDNFDFGFTTHAGEEFVDVDEAQALQNKAEAMYQAILPLLNNLAKDADKNEMIRWPNRAVKIYEFRKRLEEILNS
jgi:GTP cyclohydrolase I